MTKTKLGLHRHTVRIWQAVISAAIFLIPTNVLANPPGSGWQLKFSDEFNGSSLDTSKWSTCYRWASNDSCTNGASEDLQWYQPDEILVGNGILRLRAQKREKNGYGYTSGMISSHDKFSFQYGYAEIRAKMPSGRGFWSTFWLVPQANTWPPEIDIIEHLGHEPSRTHMSLHYRANGRTASSSSNWAGPDFSAEYHTFAVQWNSSQVIWYVDGVERKRYETDANVPAQPMHILATFALGAAWSNTPPDNSTPLPGYFDIDYIKVWQR